MMAPVAASPATPRHEEPKDEQNDDKRDLQLRADKVTFLMTFACPCAAVFAAMEDNATGEVVRNVLVSLLVLFMRVRFVHVYYYQFIPLARLLWYFFSGDYASRTLAYALPHALFYLVVRP